MRARMLVAGITLATFTTVLGAPAAFAAQPDPEPEPPGRSEQADQQTDEKSAEKADEKAAPKPNPPEASLSVSPDQVEPGGRFVADVRCTEDGAPTLSANGVSFDGRTGTVGDGVAPGTTITVRLACTNPGGSDEATDAVKVVAPAAGPAAAPAGPARVSVEPDERRPGERFRIDFSCPAGGTGDTRLTASPGAIDFDGDLDGGRVKDDARPGDVRIELTCPNGDKATDTLRVLEDRKAFLDLDPNEGYRDDKVEIEAYCPGRGDARLVSPVLDDVVLKRDGDGILRGRTRVEDDAEYGDSYAEVLCRTGEKPQDDFDVLEHRKPDLDLDPAFGKRGDEIKVYVVCDFTVGRLESDVLEDVEVTRDDDDPAWRYRARTKVLSDAKEGEHTVKIKCGDHYVDEAFFVIVDGEAKGGTQVTVYPEGAPQTGGGPVGPGPAGALGLAGLTGFATLPGRRAVRR